MKNNRKQDIAFILAQVLDINHWNMYCRNELLRLEIEIVSNQEDRKWYGLFHFEDKACIKIQSCYRVHKSQHEWEDLKNKQRFKCKRHAEYMSVGLKRYKKYWLLVKQKLLKLWKIYVENWKYLKFNSVRYIQSIFRGVKKYRKYQLLKQRIFHLNQLYIIVCENSHDYTRSRLMKCWFALYMERLKHKCSDLIVNVLYMNGYSQVLRKGKK